MKKLLTALLASLVLFGLSAPARAHESSGKKQPCVAKNDTRHPHHHPKVDKHKLKVLKQFKELKKTYTQSNEAARQMFLEFLGSSLPAADTDIQKIRDEYEQQIDRLNETITSLQNQVTDMDATIISKADEIEALKTSQQTAIDNALADQRDELTQACDDRVAAECPATGPAGEPQLVNSWSTDPLYPYALDVDGSGNVFILDNYNMAVVKYDSNGQPARWDPDTLQQPEDLAVDSQGAVYVLDRQAPDHLQKFGPDGQPVDLNSSDTAMVDPTGLFIDSADRIYVTDLGGAYGSRILVFDSSGSYIKTLGEVPELLNEFYFDVAVDEINEFIYVVTGSKVAKFDMDGGFLSFWQGTLNRPSSVAVGRQGQVFVVDSYNNEIYQYDADGTLMYTIGSKQINTPYHIVVDDSGDLYVADYFNGQVKVYR